MGTKGNTQLCRVFGANLQQARRAAGLTQDMLAERAGIAFKYLSDLENGKRNPGLDVAYRLAKALSQTLDSLCVDPQAIGNKVVTTGDTALKQVTGFVGALKPRNRRRALKLLRAAFR